MKCKCSLNNDYEVIGLCDIEKFNEKTIKFLDKSWTQIILPEKLILPENKPSIKSISKVYLDIKINSTKIIETTSSNNIPNIENLKSTGKLLLVSGIISQNISYISEAVYITAHSVKFEASFKTYIVLPENSDLEDDEYCVYACLEDIFLKPLDERTLSKSVTLFLFAHRIIKIIPNVFIFKTKDTNEEMAKVEFEKSNKKLIVTSSDKNYNDQSTVNAFIFRLRNSTETQIKATGTILGNENADNFKRDLNEVNFIYGDVINLAFNDKNKVFLTNYSEKGMDYNMISNSRQSFIINRYGITPNVLLSSIILNDINRLPVVISQFDISNKILLVNSTGRRVKPTSSGNYFIMNLYEADGRTLRQTGSVQDNNTGDNFKAAFNDQTFNWNDIIELNYNDSEIIITSYPGAGASTYIPTGNEVLFRIRQNGLTKITKLSNSIIFKTKNTDQEMAKIEFDKENKELMVSSTGKVYNTSNPNLNSLAFSFELKNSNKTSRINESENANAFRDSLNMLNFEIEDEIVLFAKDDNKVIITNFPKEGEEYHVLSGSPQIFKIYLDKIDFEVLKNTITLNDLNENPVINIQFDVLNKKILVESTGKTTNPSGGIGYFVMTLYGQDRNPLKEGYGIDGNEDGNAFKNTFNNYSFEWDDIIRLEYKENNKVIITNFPNESTLIYNPIGIEEYFKITQNGLEEFIHQVEKFKEYFKFNSFTNREMAKVEFDKLNKELIVSSTGVNYGLTDTSNAYSFILRKNFTPKVTSNIISNQNADNFKKELNNKNFEFQDDIVLTFRNPNKSLLVNYPDTGDNYSISITNNERFEITQNGITPTLKSEKIIIKSKNNEEVLTIQFEDFSGKIILSAKGVIPDPSSSAPYFTIILKNEVGVDKIRATLNSNEDGRNFKSLVNFKNVQNNKDILTFIYKDKTKVSILNFPSLGQTYTPTDYFNSFSLEQTNLRNLTFNSKIKIVNENNEEMTSIYFTKPTLNKTNNITLIATSTNAISTSTGNPLEDYVEYLQYDENSIRLNSQILKQGKSMNFKNDIDGKYADVNPINFLMLSNRMLNRIIITNYKGQSEYKVEKEPEFLEIQNGQLAPHSLNYNKIILKNSDNLEVLFIYFDKVSASKIYILPYATGNINRDSDFSFKITDLTETTIKLQITLNRGEKEPTYTYNSEFNFDDILTITSSNGSLVEIFDFPTAGTISTLTGNFQKFKITENGFENFILFPNLFTFNASNPDTEMAKLYFDKESFKLIVTSSGISYNKPSVDKAFKFTLIASDEIAIKTTAQILGNENADSFKNKLNNLSFEIGDFIKMEFNNPLKLKLINYPNEANEYLMTSGNKQSFKINQDKIVPYTLLNTIILNNSNNQIVLTIQFDILCKSLLIVSTNNITNIGTANYFTITLYDSNGIIQRQIGSVEGNSNANSFKSKFNNIDFEFGDVIKLEIEEFKMVTITNFPTASTPIYNPHNTTEWFKINKTGLESTPSVPPI